MAIIPPVLRDAWREAHNAYTRNPTRHLRWLNSRRLAADRAAFNAANPGIIPHTGAFNIAERSRLRGLTNTAKTARDAEMVLPNQIKNKRKRRAAAYARLKEGVEKQLRETKANLVAAIEARERAAHALHDSTVAGLRFWQIFKKREARVTRDRELRAARWSGRRMPLMIAVFKERQKLRKRLRLATQSYKSHDKSLAESQKRLTQRANVNFESSMSTVRADRRTARYNSILNTAHAATKTLVNSYSVVAQAGQTGVGTAAAIGSAFKAAGQELTTRSITSARPMLSLTWAAIKHVFS